MKKQQQQTEVQPEVQPEVQDDSFEKIMTALEIAEPVFEAIKDIPAMIAVAARCQLSGHFMRKTPDGKTAFDVDGFEAAWKYISGETDEKVEE